MKTPTNFKDNLKDEDEPKNEDNLKIKMNSERKMTPTPQKIQSINENDHKNKDNLKMNK